uniref:Uncharacterized protein n=1 Tax=Nelumbo nucifera TaxID=4432 RepID=A0A823A5S5_NELNU|nr:TPA_asm: hypothetical protein HUJ06_019075 [Nelumbo nucifera]
MELEAQFKDPYLSNSLQDFWGRRRKYHGLQYLALHRIRAYVKPRHSNNGKEMGLTTSHTGNVRGVGADTRTHHLLFGAFRAHMGDHVVLHPPWVLLNIGDPGEKRFGELVRLHRAVSGLLTIAFVMGTSFRLFFQQFLRCGADVRVLGEYAAVGEFVRVIFVFFFQSGIFSRSERIVYTGSKRLRIPSKL